jgi:hypothetical protein
LVNDCITINSGNEESTDTETGLKRKRKKKKKKKKKGKNRLMTRFKIPLVGGNAGRRPSKETREMMDTGRIKRKQKRERESEKKDREAEKKEVKERKKMEKEDMKQINIAMNKGPLRKFFFLGGKAKKGEAGAAARDGGPVSPTKLIQEERYSHATASTAK